MGGMVAGDSSGDRRQPHKVPVAPWADWRWEKQEATTDKVLLLQGRLRIQELVSNPVASLKCLHPFIHSINQLFIHQFCA